MAKRRDWLELELDELRLLRRDESAPDMLSRLMKLLDSKSHLIIEPAAVLLAERGLVEAAPKLRETYKRLVEVGKEGDPGCVCKLACVDALVRFEFDDVDFYREAMTLTQFEMEPERPIDRAGQVRGRATFGLLISRELSALHALEEITPLLVDSLPSARALAADAVASCGSMAAVPVLKLKLLTDESAPEVLGACLQGLLRLAPATGVPFVAEWMKKRSTSSTSRQAPETAVVEAALALGETRRDDAAAELIQFYPKKQGATRAAVLLAMGLTRQPAAIDQLLSLIEANGLDSEAALKALVPVRFLNDISDRVAQAVRMTKSRAFSALYRELFEA